MCSILVKAQLQGGEGGLSQYEDIILPVYGITMLKIRRSRDRLIFNMGIPIPGKDGLYIETGPWTFWHHMTCGDDTCLHYCKDFAEEIYTH